MQPLMPSQYSSFPQIQNEASDTKLGGDSNNTKEPFWTYAGDLMDSDSANSLASTLLVLASTYGSILGCLDHGDKQELKELAYNSKQLAEKIVTDSNRILHRAKQADDSEKQDIS